MGINAQMFARVPVPIDALDVRRLSADLVEAFDEKRFFIMAPWHKQGWDEERHALEIIEVYQQDGDDIVPREGEQFIDVHLSGRFYGPGYERGDWPFYDSVCQWLTMRLPEGSEVWYGGDSSGVCAVPMTPAYRRKIWKHFAANGHKPYTRAWGRGSAPHTCAFCAHMPMEQYGFGGRGFFSAFRCDGCGLHRVTNDGGETWISGNYEEVEAACNEHRKNHPA